MPSVEKILVKISNGRKKTQHIGSAGVVSVKGRREGCEKKFSKVSNIQYLEPNQLRATSTGNYKGKGVGCKQQVEMLSR